MLLKMKFEPMPIFMVVVVSASPTELMFESNRDASLFSMTEALTEGMRFRIKVYWFCFANWFTLVRAVSGRDGKVTSPEFATAKGIPRLCARAFLRA